MYLEGVRVLDLSRILAGPFATMILGDMGAEVLKIESPHGGDDTRHWGPPFQGEMAAYFQSCNRNKASLTLDLKQEADQVRLRELVAAADVVVDNFPPAVRARLGVAPAELVSINPRIISLGISGYRGDRSDEPGYDIMVQAESGLMGITGPREGEPFKVGVALVDVLTGMMAANGVLAALFARERRGTGAALSVSLYQTALLSLVNVAANHLVSGEPGRRWGNEHPNIVPYQSFRLADRDIIIGAGNDKQFQRLCALLGIDDPAVTGLNNAGRVKQRDLLCQRLAERLAHWKADDLIPRLRQQKIPTAPILAPHEAIARVQHWDKDAIFALEHRSLGTIRQIASPLVGTGMRQAHQPPPQQNERGPQVADRWLQKP